MSNPTIALGFGGLSAEYGDHIAHFYSSHEECQELLLGYLREGMRAGEKCVYIQSSLSDGERVVNAFDDSDGDIDRAISTGQLVLCEGDKPAGMQSALTKALKDVPKRYPRLRFVGKMTWSLEACSTTELMTWESHCNGYHDKPVVFLCQYDLRSFRGDVVMDAMRTHPLCIVGNAIHRNPYYVEPEAFLEGLRVASNQQQPPDDGSQAKRAS